MNKQEVGEEIHCLLDCQTQEMEHRAAFSKITEFYQSFISLNKIDTFIYSLSNENEQVLTITAGQIRHFNDIRELMFHKKHG